jgi:hypothetical protein
MLVWWFAAPKADGLRVRRGDHLGVIGMTRAQEFTFHKHSFRSINKLLAYS